MSAAPSARSTNPSSTVVAPVRVMCVDDHRLMREGIRRIVALQPDMVVVAEASNGAEAVELFQKHRPDVTLMDLQLPTMNGHEAIKAIRRLQPDYPLWRDFAYEYEHGKLAIDVINGSPLLREWVDDAGAAPGDLEAPASADEREWLKERESYLRY